MRNDSKLRVLFVLCGLSLLPASATLGQDLVAPTGPLTPQEQQKKFKLPPGFEIQLVASEPDVNKPMNLRFDAHGRLWVTHSLEYPYAAKDDRKARDAITIFSNFGADGRARKSSRFAEHLNIPIGVLPISDREALAWSIPNIYRLTDSNGDGVADQKNILFGPYGYIDTHGDQNSFTRWLDGWVYACHGFNNRSQVKRGGVGPVLLEMHSGNTYRFRPDGSAIEQFTWGQVNPFGLSFDPLGNLFSADCHSRPVTMLLREGYYDSFGKPHDGLGFAPETTDIDHGGTGIAGVVYYAARQFPANYRDVLFVGNVVTSRVHCDRLQWNGSSPRVAKVEDFITCEDQWFRPVYMQLGPDGALYIADFYNCIIGHYEVRLDHPRRDRERGRIWRVVYNERSNKKSQQAATPSTTPDFDKASLTKLVELLGDHNLAIRTMATHALVDRFGKQAGQAARAVLESNATPGGLAAQFDAAAQRAHALWVVARVDGLDETLARRLAGDPQPIVRVHLLKALGEIANWQPWHFAMTRCRLGDSNPFVRRAAASALAQHPNAANLRPLLRLLRGTSGGDAQLIHATRIALRDQIRDPAVAAKLPDLRLVGADRKGMLEFAALAPNGPAALLIYEEAIQGNVDRELLTRALPAVTKFIDAARIDALISLVRKQYAGDRDFQISLLRSMYQGLAQRGAPPSGQMLAALADLLKGAIAGDRSTQWANYPVPGAEPSISPWKPEPRNYKDGQNQIPLISSLREPGPGERLTGILRSPVFALPAKLSFWMCGHNGVPGTPDVKRNYARLVLTDGTEVARGYPPRNDMAERYEWDLAAHAGKRGYVEVIDNLVADGFAWLAVSRFDPPVIRVPDYAVGDAESSRADAIRLAAECGLSVLSPEVASAASDHKTHASVRLAACEALLRLQSAAADPPLVELLADSQQPLVLRQQAAELLGRLDRDEPRKALLANLKTAPQSLAVSIAAALATRPTSAVALLAEIRAGRASARILREPTVLDRLKTAKLVDFDKQLAELAARLSPADDRIARLIEQRRKRYLAGKFNVETGRAVFARTACSACHRIGAVGATIGPALDGIGVRGIDRLLEDILDPSRNVDQAFRATSLATKDGQIYTGFGLREEGQTLIYYDNAGKMQRLPLAELDAKTASNLSPMPANVPEIISETDFYHLLSFLLSQRGVAAK